MLVPSWALLQSGSIRPSSEEATRTTQEPFGTRFPALGRLEAPEDGGVSQVMAVLPHQFDCR